jgi:hypothetical protein
MKEGDIVKDSSGLIESDRIKKIKKTTRVPLAGLAIALQLPSLSLFLMSHGRSFYGLFHRLHAFLTFSFVLAPVKSLFYVLFNPLQS